MVDANSALLLPALVILGGIALIWLLTSRGRSLEVQSPWFRLLWRR